MKYEELKTWNLQMFAEDGGEDGNAGGDGNTGGADGDPKLSFEDFLKLEGNQAEFDRRITKAVATAVKNEKEKWDILHNDSISEAEKLAKMTKEEKLKYERDKMEKKLKEYERKETLGSMKKTAREILEERDIHLSDGILDSLVSEDAEATKTAVESFAKIFAEEVEKAVKAKLKGDSHKKNAGEKTMTKEEIMAIQDPELRQKKMLEHRDLFHF